MSLSGSFTWVSRALPSGAGWKAIREFFAYHGVWAIGVRGMRLWSLRTKMFLLVAVMALPMLPLVVHQILDQNRLVPYDKLTAETAMYWRVLTQFLAKQVIHPQQKVRLLNAGVAELPPLLGGSGSIHLNF